MKAEIDINIKCPNCGWVMIRNELINTTPKKHTIECPNPLCNEHGVLYEQPQIELVKY